MFLRFVLPFFLDVAPIGGPAAPVVLILAVVIVAAVILIRAIRRNRAAGKEHPVQTNTEDPHTEEADEKVEEPLQSKTDPVFNERKGL